MCPDQRYIYVKKTTSDKLLFHSMQYDVRNKINFTKDEYKVIKRVQNNSTVR